MSILMFLLSFHFSFLDTPFIYENPTAYIRSPESSLIVKPTGFDKATFIDGAIGKALPIFTISYKKEPVFQLGLEAATWVLLKKKGQKFPLLTQDFLLAVPLYYRFNNVSGAIKYNHISSHLGDGMTDVKRIGYSRDFPSFEIAYDMYTSSLSSKVYTYTSYATKMFPKRLGRFSWGSGMEVNYERATYLTPYVAYDLRYNQDVDSWDHSTQLGLEIARDTLYSVRIAGTGYVGSNRRGQLLGYETKEIGIGLIFR